MSADPYSAFRIDRPSKARRITVVASLASVVLSTLSLLGIAITGFIVSSNGGSILPAANNLIIAVCIAKIVSWIVLIVCASKSPII